MKVLTPEGKIVEAIIITPSEEAAYAKMSAELKTANGAYLTHSENDSVLRYLMQNFKMELRNPPTPEAEGEEVAVEVAPEVDREIDRYAPALVEPIAEPLAGTV
jgi:hypothetical protein